MRNSLTYNTECSAYPGKYVPMPELEELLNDKKQCMTPPLNVDEFDDCFRVELSLPGIYRQDIVVSVEDSILTIKVIHKDANVTANKPWIHEFDVDYFERQVTLPINANPEFTAAEYREGILRLLIPKTNGHSILRPGRIVVY